jgi:hypothetical protein
VESFTKIIISLQISDLMNFFLCNEVNNMSPNPAALPLTASQLGSADIVARAIKQFGGDIFPYFAIHGITLKGA